MNPKSDQANELKEQSRTATKSKSKSRNKNKKNSKINKQPSTEVGQGSSTVSDGRAVAGGSNGKEKATKLQEESALELTGTPSTEVADSFVAVNETVSIESEAVPSGSTNGTSQMGTCTDGGGGGRGSSR